MTLFLTVWAVGATVVALLMYFELGAALQREQRRVLDRQCEQLDHYTAQLQANIPRIGLRN